MKYAQSLIDDFELVDKNPQITVSVDMLDTGIDVPAILNLVFFKMVRSKTKFWQMVGRGTRLCEDVFGPGEHKEMFYIFDYCQNFEYFGENPDGYEPLVTESVKQRIFRRRLELALVLQEAAPEEANLQGLCNTLKDQMHELVSGLNVDNFIVRKQRQLVETFTERERWQTLKPTDVEEVGAKIGNLPSRNDDHETARLFDLLILNLQVAMLQQSDGLKRYIVAVQQTAAELEEKQAIPLVAAQMKLILALQTEHWWQDVTLPLLEDVRVRLRELAKFVDKKTSHYETYTNFQDELDIDGISEMDIVQADPHFKDYRKRVERYIREHKDHITICRLKNNEPVSATDIKALEDLLFAEGAIIPREEYTRIYGDKPVGLLVRSIIGLDRNAAKQAFAELLAKAPLHPDQISFLNEIIEYLVKNGAVEPKSLFEPPFTHHHDLGVAGVMGEVNAKSVVELVTLINQNANVG